MSVTIKPTKRKVSLEFTGRYKELPSGRSSQLSAVWEEGKEMATVSVFLRAPGAIFNWGCFSADDLEGIAKDLWELAKQMRTP